MTTCTLAGGCFWCLDAVYQKLRGVEGVVSGYAGGTAEDADYYHVVAGNTGHAEAVQITFHESEIPADIVLEVFFTIHDPTSLNRQGADTGPQYRSAMFYESDEQKALYQAAIDRAQTNYDAPIVTTLEPLDAFYEAEAEHQNYYENNRFNPYCPIVISPKIRKAKKRYQHYFKEEK